jgi:hypothetical protein
MGCCQINLLGPELNLLNSPNMQEKPPDKDKAELHLPISVSIDNSIPPPTLTPYFGKKFNFDDTEKSNHETKHLEIS